MSIIHQKYKNIEVLIIDAFSSDDVQTISSELGAQVIALDGEGTRAKSIGLSKANGEFVFFVDSNTTLAPCVIEQCVMTCSDKMISLVRLFWSILSETGFGSELGILNGASTVV